MFTLGIETHSTVGEGNGENGENGTRRECGEPKTEKPLASLLHYRQRIRSTSTDVMSGFKSGWAIKMSYDGNLNGSPK